MIPEPAYVFKHAVIQDVAYNSLLMRRRKELHGAVGRRSRNSFVTGWRAMRNWLIISAAVRTGSRVMQYSRLASDVLTLLCQRRGDRALHSCHRRHGESSPYCLRRHWRPAPEPQRNTKRYRQASKNYIDDYALALECARSGNDRARECRFLLGLSLAQFNANRSNAGNVSTFGSARRRIKSRSGVRHYRQRFSQRAYAMAQPLNNRAGGRSGPFGRYSQTGGCSPKQP